MGKLSFSLLPLRRRDPKAKEVGTYEGVVELRSALGAWFHGRKATLHLHGQPRSAVALLLAFSLLTGLLFAAGSLAMAASTSPLPASDVKRGLRYGGLERPTQGPCNKTFKLVRSDRCSHGPDPVPENVDISQDRPPLSSASGRAAEGETSGTGAAATGGSIACDGDGSSGKRFQAVYARASDRPDRYSTYAASIAQWAGAADRVFNDSAAQTGGIRRMRWLTDAGCNLTVSNVTLSSTGDDNFDNTIDQLFSKGFNRTDRIYIIWMDANVYCGIATVDIDDSAAATNASNTGPAYARTDSGCWGMRDSVEAHEVMHTIGGVQRSAPHSTHRLNSTDPGTFHCFDESDRMCYKDADGVTLLSACNDSLKEALFDCQSDDYFHTNPPPENYLAKFWNPANSAFLIKGESSVPPTSKYTPLSPARILDTRFGTGGISAAVGAGQTIKINVTGVGGVPSTGATAVMLNVAVTQPTAASHLTVFPSGVSPPNTSNLNFAGNQTTSNLVVAKVGTNGQVSVLNNSGSVHVVIDVQGFYSGPSTATATAASGSSAASSSQSGTAESESSPQQNQTSPEPESPGRGDSPNPARSPRPAVGVNLAVTPPGMDDSVGISAEIPVPIGLPGTAQP